MRLHICAVGRIRSGPERDLADDYLTRLARSGKSLSLGPCLEHEVDERKSSTIVEQARGLLRSIPDNAVVVAMDERGEMMSSREFALFLERMRDSGAQDIAFVIGGADGLDQSVRDAAQKRMSLGAMVWPHKLARVMLAEQLYRALTILSGSPYHRD